MSAVGTVYVVRCEESGGGDGVAYHNWIAGVFDDRTVAHEFVDRVMRARELRSTNFTPWSADRKQVLKPWDGGDTPYCQVIEVPMNELGKWGWWES